MNTLKYKYQNNHQIYCLSNNKDNEEIKQHLPQINLSNYTYIYLNKEDDLLYYNDYFIFQIGLI